MNYNKYINSFADSNEYNTYIESDNAYSPNIGFIEETKQVKWAEKTIADYIFYGTTEATTDFMIGYSADDGDSDCIKVHVVPSTDGGDNIMYATKEDIVKTPVIIYIDAEITSIKKWKIDISNVTDMSCMFEDCTALTSLDLSSFNTSSVTDMSYMFNRCSALTLLDLSSFDTSNVTNISQMFNGCTALTSLDLSSFNTSSVTNMSYMFRGCNSLTSLTLTSSFFNSSTVKEFDFSGLTSWTESTSLSQFVNAISSKDGTGKTVKLSNATKTALTDAQKKQITDAKWTIA